MSIADKLTKQPPYKLLALDGGGIRGLIAIEVLAEIERLLKAQPGRGDDFVLADYFDYVAGTSTGAVIATCIALGLPMKEVRTFYLESAELMFEKASVLKRLHYKFEDEPIAKKLRSVIADQTGEAITTLGSSKLRTLLMMVLRNASTDSPWPLSNNPQAKYNCPDDRPGCNLKLPLWQLVRASTAAPTYFPPEQIAVGPNQFVFVDGGVTTYNNPAFQLFLMATVEPYNLNWKPKKPEDMLLVSIGTGTSPEANGSLQPEDMHLLFNASSIPSALMFAALNEQDFLCRVFGKCLTGDPLDRELHSMVDGSAKHGTRGPVDPKLFTYLRYNAELTRPGLAALGLQDIEPENVQKLDSVKHKKDLQRVGEAVARANVKAAHFAGFN
ncbi:MAG TPA: patatin-like phospholipase family protein [Burkholderiales bacterium]|nr:patatin-like phospholipase family protein [Burkholderiales bacterium]